MTDKGKRVQDKRRLLDKQRGTPLLAQSRAAWVAAISCILVACGGGSSSTASVTPNGTTRSFTGSTTGATGPSSSVLPILYTTQAPTAPASPSGRVAWPASSCSNSTNNATFLVDSKKTGDWSDWNGYQVSANPAPWEWVPADAYGMAPGGTLPDELDDSGVLSGTVVFEPDENPGHPGLSNNDLPFTHPFGYDYADSYPAALYQALNLPAPPRLGPDVPFNDFETFLAPDKAYYSELAPANGSMADPSGEYAPAYSAAKAAPFSFTGPGVMGTEMDGALVPSPYRPAVGDRVAVWGRWIVDCGHQPNHTEIHQPLLTASAHPIAIAPGMGPGTTVQIIGRPYVVGQVCFESAQLRAAPTDDPRCHPQDSNGLAGCPNSETSYSEGNSLYTQFICELNHDLGHPLSSEVNAVPDIYTVPFSGIRIMTFYVNTPSAPPTSSGYSLEVRYHFTVRDGVTVTMVPSARPGELAVIVTMNSTAYVPAPLPTPLRRYLAWGQLEALDPVLPSDVVSGLNDLCTWANTCGINVGQYSNVYPAVMNSPIDYSSGALQPLSGFKNNGSGINVDDSQPFPIVGWAQLQWLNCATSTACQTAGPVISPIPLGARPAELAVQGATALATPANTCLNPTILFTGTIETNGQAGQVTYKWVRSDGVSTNPATISIARGISVTNVSMKWTVPSATPYGSNSARLVVTSPQVAISKPATFQKTIC